MPRSGARDVFINCPFDDDFTPSLHALVFAVLACGFRARCSKEMDDASETRIEKLYNIIEQCRFGVHDISRTELDKVNSLPRFNMPLELGIFLGAKRFGDDDQKKKRALVLDVEQYRYQKFISDLAGIDPVAHGGVPRDMVRCVRNWLNTVATAKKHIPPTQTLLRSYDEFVAALPAIASDRDLDPKRIEYPDFERLAIAWVTEKRKAGALP